MTERFISNTEREQLIARYEAEQARFREQKKPQAIAAPSSANVRLIRFDDYKPQTPKESSAGFTAAQLTGPKATDLLRNVLPTPRRRFPATKLKAWGAKIASLASRRRSGNAEEEPDADFIAPAAEQPLKNESRQGKHRRGGLLALVAAIALGGALGTSSSEHASNSHRAPIAHEHMDDQPGHTMLHSEDMTSPAKLPASVAPIPTKIASQPETTTAVVSIRPGDGFTNIIGRYAAAHHVAHYNAYADYLQLENQFGPQLVDGVATYPIDNSGHNYGLTQPGTGHWHDGVQQKLDQLLRISQ